MNKKQAVLLRRITEKISPIGSGVVHTRGYVTPTRTTRRKKTAGWPYEIIRNTGFRDTYQRLKKAFKSVPRTQRAQWLEDLLDHAEEDYATDYLGGCISDPNEWPDPQRGAREVLADGGWGNGNEFAPDERRALEALASGASIDSENGEQHDA